MKTDPSAELSTKERLLEAAISILGEEGETGIRVDHVAKTAGFTKPVMYHHFADREALIAAAQAEQYRRSLIVGLDSTMEDLETSTTVEEFFSRLQKWTSTFNSPEGEQRRRFRMEVLGSAVSRPALMSAVVETSRIYCKQLSTLLRLAQAHGWIRKDINVKDLAQWWIGLTLSRFMVEIDKDEYSTDAWDEITNSVMRSMFVGL